MNLGAKRILTSGQHSKAIDGIENLKRYQEIASNELIIIPGGGINGGNCNAFAEAEFKEIHASATEIIEQTHEKKVPMNSPKFLQENIEVISNSENITAIFKNLENED
ncbi:cytoplasmic copper homeostasis protein CutC [Nonlabens ulvanivorans]|uniref:Copper homeostasis protein cutC homolog n=1 Tax=Nonlabens ulvanivorans TaxID=906888 RepID=A0A081DA17_NONUL|nr:cytoplasmic copper homeostasis protein CutC [Nonlabens ulvanivorans]